MLLERYGPLVDVHRDQEKVLRHAWWIEDQKLADRLITRFGADAALAKKYKDALSRGSGGGMMQLVAYGAQDTYLVG